MPSPTKGSRKGSGGGGNGTISKKGIKLTEKATSFHGRGSITAGEMLPRPRTVPNLVASGRRAGEDVAAGSKKPGKLLLNVTIQRSVGAVQVLLPLDATAEEVIAAALRQYAKEARRPVLPSADPSAFDLHYSQFTLESLGRSEKLTDLGSRNFFMCPKHSSAAMHGGGSSPAAGPSCSKEVDAVANKGLPFLNFMNFLL